MDSALLTAATTEELFREFATTRDERIRDELVRRHANLVRFLAGKFANRGEPVDDLIQVGSIGVINAIDRYEPDRGIRFSTYATPTIVGEIKRYFRDRAWSVKVPRWLQELNQRVVHANEALAQTLGRAPSIAEIAAHVGASEEETMDAMALGNAYESISLDAHLGGEAEAGPATLADSLGEEDPQLSGLGEYDDLQAAVAMLEPRARMIIHLRFYEELPQTEVARRLGISQMHVSRLQHRALRQLRDLLQGNQRRDTAA
jgi:RNA polymerase sigma-B factor